MSLSIQHISVMVQESEILHDISFEIGPGEVHVLLGPNGSGKSTLANAIAGHPKYVIAHGQIHLNGEEISNIKPNERAKKGLLLSMQQTPAIEGVSVTQMLRIAKQSLTEKQLNPIDFHRSLVEIARKFDIESTALTRSVNVGFSGGEKKKLELLQLMVLDPTYVILDEADSGLDIDAKKMVARTIKELKHEKKGVLVITHDVDAYETIPLDCVHVIINGQIVRSGNKELLQKIKKNGYAEFYADQRSNH